MDFGNISSSPGLLLFSSLEIMLEEVLSYLRLLILLGFLDVRGGKNETSCDEKTNDTVFRILLFVLESV